MSPWQGHGLDVWPLGIAPGPMGPCLLGSTLGPLGFTCACLYLLHIIRISYCLLVLVLVPLDFRFAWLTSKCQGAREDAALKAAPITELTM